VIFGYSTCYSTGGGEAEEGVVVTHAEQKEKVAEEQRGLDVKQKGGEGEEITANEAQGDDEPCNWGAAKDFMQGSGYSDEFDSDG
jgi:hypothetical protein